MILVPSTIDDCGPGKISFCAERNLHKLLGLSGGSVFVPQNANVPESVQAIRVDDPKYSFMLWVRDNIVPGNPIKHIGKSCEIDPTAVIGGKGFGYHKGLRFPHIGSVVVGDYVDIGAHTCIDRGSIGDTVIGDGTKVDNLVHIAHNVRVGTECLIVAGTVVGGSAVIGDNVFVGMGALIRNKVTIGDGAFIGMGAVVVKDVPAGATVKGNPAR